MYNKSEDKLLSYSEFTNILLDKKRSVWFEQLINFFIDVGEFKRRDNISKALDAIKSLSQYNRQYVSSKYSRKPFKYLLFNSLTSFSLSFNLLR